MSFKIHLKREEKKVKELEEDLKLKETKESPLCIVFQLCSQCRTLQRG